MKECCEGVVEKCCGEVLYREVLWTSVVKELWRSAVKRSGEAV